jgi:hypothetical protein
MSKHFSGAIVGTPNGMIMPDIGRASLLMR